VAEPGKTEQIDFTDGYSATVDSCDLAILIGHNWYLATSRLRSGKVRIVGARSTINGRLVLMHRFIMGVTDPRILVDHQDHNTLNNRRLNLRICGHSQNQANRLIPVTNTSGYKGVRLTDEGRWMAFIKTKGKQRSLGTFLNKHTAALAYNDAAREIFGEFALLNEVKNA